MLSVRAVGAPLDRIDGPKKVTGTATYAYEYAVDGIAYGFPVQSTIASGTIVAIDAGAALALPGVLAVLAHDNAPKLASVEDPALAVFQSEGIAYRGQYVAIVVAETYEIARHAASLVTLQYRESESNVVLRADGDLYAPKALNAGFKTDTAVGDVDAAFDAAPVKINHTYTTPAYHNNPLEPHATIAIWTDGGVTLYDANQGPHNIREDVATAFGLDAERVRIIAPYVGGGFGSKAFTHPHVIATVMAARMVGRPVKMALTRQQMFAGVGYRTPTIQRIRLAADAAGHLTAISHDVVEQTSQIEEFAEQTAVATRMMYESPNRSTTHRLARLDLPTPSIMRAPGETPGMYALESAMDEMAIACGLDPIEFRVRNEPKIDPDTGHPFSSRGLIACLREGARRFGWDARSAQPRTRREGEWLVGMGVASSTYPTRRRPSSAHIHLSGDGRYAVSIDASDIGTGTWTALTQIAADALDAPVERIDLHIGDSALPKAPGAGGSMGITSWGSAIVEAANTLRARLHDEYHDNVPPGGVEATGNAGKNPHAEHFSMHAYGAQFVEVRVNAETGETRVPRMTGVFATGRIVNPKTARSQFLGGMTMGLSMALHEESVLDPQFGDYVNHDFAEYHIAVNADVGAIDIAWIDEDDRYVNAMGAKGIGEIGMVGTAAAIANAVFNATGVRVRDLPIRLEKLIA